MALAQTRIHTSADDLIDAPAPHLTVVPSPPEKRPVAGATLDLDPSLARSLGVGVLAGLLVTLVMIALPLTILQGWEYGFGVAGQVAFWCGTGFGLIFGAAAYTARAHGND